MDFLRPYASGLLRDPTTGRALCGTSWRLELFHPYARIRAVEAIPAGWTDRPGDLASLWLYATLEGRPAGALARLCEEHDG